MKKIFFFLLLFTGGFAAQTFIHKIAPAITPRSNVTDSVKILAVMVDFKKDSDDKTFGDGTFGSIYSMDYADSIIDPLPHDRTYFENHLEFAQNYFRNASSGKTSVSYYVLPNVIHLSKVIRDYSPPINSDDYSNLGKFARDVWEEVNKKFIVDFSKFNMFVIFHAGVGNDVSLPGSIGLERDLPSVFLNLNSLKKYFGENFNGFEVNNFKITNSAILPETESREMQTVVGKSLIQLSINGLIVADIASFLGLPDLFNTKTGNSAIGRMGLMDGQSIFAYAGLFPPEPSAWEKIKLGWEIPAVVTTDAKVTVVTRLAAQPFSNTTIIKIPINSHEYFLIENRQRDAVKNGAIVTYKLGKKVFKKYFQKDEDGFRSYNVDSLKGVVTNIDEFDWALPGSGILIWHVDQNIIDSTIANNRINADENRKGIFLEEADGIQDIGVKFTNIFGDVIVGEGEAVDFWYSSNNSKYYENKFTPFTHPNTNSNDGSSSFISMMDFSDKSNIMSFNVSFSLNSFKRFNSFPIVLPYKTIPFKASYLSGCSTRDSSYLIIADNLKNLTVYNLNGKRNFTNFGFTNKKPAVYADSLNIVIVGTNGKQLNVLYSNNQGKQWSKYSTELKDTITSTPVIIKETNGEEFKIFIGNLSGQLITANFNLIQREIKIIAQGDYFNEPLLYFAGNGVNYIVASRNKIKDASGTVVYFNSDEAIKQLFELTNNGEYFTIVLLQSGKLLILKNGIEYAEKDAQISFVAGGALKNDGNNYLAAVTKENIELISISGAVTENYPFQENFNSKFMPYLLAFGNSDSNNPNIISMDAEGRLFLINSVTGKTQLPFPLSIGSEVGISPVVFNANYSDSKKLLTIALADITNRITIIRKEKPAKYNIYWGELNANALNTNFINFAGIGNSNKEFFPLNEAYNWPNPVYKNKTYFHFYAGEHSNVTIRIFDLSGKMIVSLTKNVPGKTESEIQWDVSNIQSGVYFAYLNIKGDLGKESSTIIKVVVVH